MSHLDKLRGKFLRLMLLIGLVIASVIPAYSWASAQDGSAPIWVVRSLSTSEYGVTDPKGLAFSSAANTFLLVDGNANVTFVTMGEDHVGSRVISETQNDPLNVAFDDQTSSLLVFDHGKAKLTKIKADRKGLPDASSLPTGFVVDILAISDPQGLAFDPSNGNLFILDAGNSQIMAITAHPTLGFDANEAIRSNRVQRVSLKNLGS